MISTGDKLPWFRIQRIDTALPRRGRRRFMSASVGRGGCRPLPPPHHHDIYCAPMSVPRVKVNFNQQCFSRFRRNDEETEYNRRKNYQSSLRSHSVLHRDSRLSYAPELIQRRGIRDGPARFSPSLFSLPLKKKKKKKSTNNFHFQRGEISRKENMKRS